MSKEEIINHLRIEIANLNNQIRELNNNTGDESCQLVYELQIMTGTYQKVLNYIEGV